MTVPIFVMNNALKQAESYLGGPIGAAIEGLVGTTAVSTVEISELGQKMADERATFDDIIRATTALEGSLLALGILGGALGIVAAPGALAVVAVVAAGVYSTYYKNQTASDDVIQELIDGIQNGNQPWIIAKAVTDAYGAEVARQKRIDATTNTTYTSARTWVAPRVDPLILDLDGDGIETMGIRPGAAVLFDHDGDGTRTGSGWVKADDGILVLDLDGNGQIDSGRELFGDQTLVQSGPNAGQRAASGFAALAQYDANADGRIDSADALYSQLQVWQDLNQDGISQSNELKTLAQLGIASIQVSGTARNTALIDATTGMASGNTLQTSGSFTRVDGSVGVSGDLLLASNHFYRVFTDEPQATARCHRRLTRLCDGFRAETGMSPRGATVVCYRTKSKRRNKDGRGLASLAVAFEGELALWRDAGKNHGLEACN